jgi:hypothetical protein
LLARDDPLAVNFWLKIKYSTVLSNYAMSLKNNPAAERWTKGYQKIPIGLEGECVIYSGTK